VPDIILSELTISGTKIDNLAGIMHDGGSNPSSEHLVGGVDHSTTKCIIRRDEECNTRNGYADIILDS
jgi:hypothetical protein